MLLGCFWLTVCYPATQFDSSFCNSPSKFSKLVRTHIPLCMSWRQTVGEGVQWAGGDYRPPRTSPAPQPLWPPTGRWQIHALLPTVTVYRCGISRESFGDLRRGNNIQRFMVSGAEELSGSRGNGWCDAGCVWHRVRGRLSSCFPSTNLQHPYKEDKDRDERRLRWTLVPFSSFDHSWNTSFLTFWG